MKSMDETVKKDILSVLRQAVFLIEKQDFIDLKELSSHVIHNASVMQDQDSLQAAVAVFALSKILVRADEAGKDIAKEIRIYLIKAVNYLDKNDDNSYRNEVKGIFREMSKREKKLFLYIQNAIEKANIVKGSDIYRHGISIGRAAEILGISQWDLMSFIGKTRIADEEEVPYFPERLEFAKSLFKVQ